MKKIILFLLFSFSITLSSFSQTPVVPPHLYGIKDPATEVMKYCGQCMQLMSNKPEEIVSIVRK